MILESVLKRVIVSIYEFHSWDDCLDLKSTALRPSDSCKFSFPCSCRYIPTMWFFYCFYLICHYNIILTHNFDLTKHALILTNKVMTHCTTNLLPSPTHPCTHLQLSDYVGVRYLTAHWAANEAWWLWSHKYW